VLGDRRWRCNFNHWTPSLSRCNLRRGSEDIGARRLNPAAAFTFRLAFFTRGIAAFVPRAKAPRLRIKAIIAKHYGSFKLLKKTFFFERSRVVVNASLRPVYAIRK
jgi:hypothetical protein